MTLSSSKKEGKKKKKGAILSTKKKAGVKKSEKNNGKLMKSIDDCKKDELVEEAKSYGIAISVTDKSGKRRALLKKELYDKVYAHKLKSQKE